MNPENKELENQFNQFQQPIGQINTQLPETLTPVQQEKPFQSNNQPIGNVPKKKKTGLIIGIIVVIMAALLLFNILNQNKDKKVSGNAKKTVSNLDLKTYSNSKSNDNLAISFKASKNGYYAIDLKEANIGDPLTASNEDSSNVLKNDLVSISHFYRTGFTDGNVSINKLWGVDKIKIGTGFSKIPEDSTYIDYEILENEGNYYLIHSKWKTSSLQSYNVYIGNSEQDYFFEITASSNSSDLETAKKLYTKLLDNSEICYINFDENGKFISSTTSIKNNTKVDTSNWRFLPDMILEYYIKNGLIYKSSIKTENFNHNSRAEISMYQTYEYNGKPYEATFTIDKITQEDYEKVTVEKKRKESNLAKAYDLVEGIKLDAFDEAFLCMPSKTSAPKAQLRVKAGSNYYKIETGLGYDAISNTDEKLAKKVVKVLNQIFY